MALADKDLQKVNWEIEIFYDGHCPLCKREVEMIRRLDKQNKIRYTDITSPEFDPGVYGKPLKDFMDYIQGKLPNGHWVEGVEVFRRVYSAIGFSAIVALTRLPGISSLLNLAYHLFAKNRLRLTGRCNDGNCEFHH